MSGFLSSEFTNTGNIQLIQQSQANTHNPTGWFDINKVSLNCDEVNLEFTVSPKSPATSFAFYIDGVEHIKNTTQKVSFPDITGLYFIYFNENGILTESTTSFFSNDSYVFVAYFYYNATSKKAIICGYELHGNVNRGIHLNLHSQGAKYKTGLVSGNYSLIGTGSNNSDAQLSISSGQIMDEDILITITQASTPTDIFEQNISPILKAPIIYLSGTDWDSYTATNYPVKPGTNRIHYNKNTAGTWTSEETPSNDTFVAMWVFATNDIHNPIQIMMGQRYDSSLSDAQTNNLYSNLSLSTSMPFLEFKLLYRLIFKTNSAYSNIPKAILVDLTDQRAITGIQVSAISVADHNLLNNRTDTNSHPSSAISYDNTLSGLDADNVKLAIDELNTIKMDKIVSGIQNNYASFNNAGQVIDSLHNFAETEERRMWINSGMCVEPTYIDNGNGTLTINDGTCVRMYTNASWEGEVYDYDNLVGGTFTLTDGIQNFIVASYNSGTPIITLTTNRNVINYSDVVPMFTTYREGTVIHVLSWDKAAKGAATRLIKRFVRTERFNRESGLVLSEDASRHILISSGLIWYGVVENSLPSFSSATEVLGLVKHNGSGDYIFDYTTSIYNNTQYDNGTGLVDLTTGRYAVNWVFRSVSNVNTAYYVLGTGDYTLSEALNSSVPSGLPTLLSFQCELVGRIIVLKGATNSYKIESAYTETFQGAGITDHKDLLNIGTNTHAQIDSHIASTSNPHNVTKAQLGLDTTDTPTFAGANIGNVSNTEMQYLDGVTSAIQTQINGKEPIVTKGNLTEVTSSVLTITGGTGSVIGSGITIVVKPANTSQSGYLSSTDWNTFNNKEPAITKNTAFNKNYSTTVTDVKMAGTQSIGSIDALPRIDHIHPSDTAKAGVIYRGSMYFDNPTAPAALTLTNQNQWYPFTGFVTGVTSGVTFDNTNKQLVLATAGDYHIRFNVACAFSRNNGLLYVYVFNNGSLSSVIGSVCRNSSSNIINISANDTITVAANATINIRFLSVGGAGDTVTIYHSNVNVTRLS